MGSSALEKLVRYPKVDVRQEVVGHLSLTQFNKIPHRAILWIQTREHNRCSIKGISLSYSSHFCPIVC